MKKSRWVVALADDRFAGDYKKGDKLLVVMKTKAFRMNKGGGEK